jgi:hypothetical protein
MTEVLSATPKTLIVSDNVVEAEDLTEMLAERGLGPVAHARDIQGAQDVFASTSGSLQLMIFGLSLHKPDAKGFLETMASERKPLVVIDGQKGAVELNGAGILLRPFSTSDVMAALKHVGLSD